ESEIHYWFQIEVLRRFASLSVSVFRAYGNRCLAYTNNKNYDRGIADCDKAIELDLKSAKRYTNRCWAALDRGRAKVRDAVRTRMGKPAKEETSPRASPTTTKPTPDGALI